MGSNKTEARKQLAGALLHRLFPGQVRRDVCVGVGGGGGGGERGVYVRRAIPPRADGTNPFFPRVS